MTHPVSRARNRNTGRSQTRMTGLGCVSLLCFAVAALALTPWAHGNEEAANSTNADQLWTGGGLELNLTGAGVTVGVWEAQDAGNWEVRDTHETFRSFNTNSGLWDGPTRVSYGDADEAGSTSDAFSRHATHVAGTIGGAHIPGNESRWGMAPGVQIVSYSSGLATSEMTNEAAGVDITNHSYGFNYSPWDRTSWNVDDGNGGTVSKDYDTWAYDWDTTDQEPAYGRYSGTTRDIDLAMVARPKMLSFYSAGNDRNDGDDRYTDHQGDGKFVTQFSQSFINNNTIIGEDLGDRYYLVDSANYDPSTHGFEPGGFDSLGAHAVAKNNVVVGAAFDFTADPHEGNGGGISTSNFTSYGPTDDGGLGVDLVANGVSLDSASDTGDSDYVRFSGTSMSSPNAAGTAALILEHWRNENGGSTPDSATQKGLLMHTATDATSFGTGPDYATGYGMVNAAEAVGHITEAITDPAGARERHIWEDTLFEGDTLSYSMVAVGGAFKASLSWLDPAAPTSSSLDDRTIKLINDLDIWVADQLGNTYYPWVLDPENPNAAATRDGHNRVDNFTQVAIDSLIAGTQLTVNISNWGALESGSQDYALFVSGATQVIPEPTTIALLVLAAPLALRRRRA